eukprot:5642506-Pleurochrysis_carterae.AAC.1
MRSAKRPSRQPSERPPSTLRARQFSRALAPFPTDPSRVGVGWSDYQLQYGWRAGAAPEGRRALSQLPDAPAPGRLPLHPTALRERPRPSGFGPRHPPLRLLAFNTFISAASVSPRHRP